MTHRKSAISQLLIVGASASILAACQTGPGLGASGRGGELATSCLTGATVGAVGSVIYDILSGKRSTSSAGDRLKDIGRVAIAGCVVNVAVTSVGKLLTDSRQRSRYDDALQRDSRRRALEQEKYAQARSRVQAQPSATPQQAAARDAELARLQKEYEASMAQPVVADLGGGASATIQGDAPVTGGDFNGCQTKTMLVVTPSGQARQQEMFCPNDKGDLVRVDARAA